MSTANDAYGVLQVVRAALVGNAAVAALVGDRVVVVYAQGADSEQPTYPLVVLLPAGGRLAWGGHQQDVSVEVRVYAATAPGEALEIYNALTNAAHGERLTLTVEGTERSCIVQEVARPSLAFDNAVRRHVAIARWRVFGIW